MFGSGSNSAAAKPENSMPTDDDAGNAPAGKKSPSPDDKLERGSPPSPIKAAERPTSGDKRSGNGSPPTSTVGSAEQKKRRSSGVSSKASSLLASAKNTLNFSQVNRSESDHGASQTPLQKLGRHDPALVVPQGQYNNSAGESLPGPRSSFRVGVWEDKNKKCRRTMEDTHAFLYNFLQTPEPALSDDGGKRRSLKSGDEDGEPLDMAETDNGYFAIFDGHAGNFAADWCGKKLHVILEDIVRKHPNQPLPELLDQTFTTVDAQLEKLPLKNSGCTAAIAVLRWEDRVPSSQSATGSQALAPAAAAAARADAEPHSKEDESGNPSHVKSGSATAEAVLPKLKPSASRQRVLYTANVGDARIILCRNGKALRLSYDHKGSDENEGKRIANAGGLILNNRVNGVLAVTRALGDTYMKDLVTGHPYTTETVIQSEVDEFIIIACDGLWDVCSDQEAVDLVREVHDPTTASKLLVDHALSRFSTDNLSCMIVRFDQAPSESAVSSFEDATSYTGKVSETDKIIRHTKKVITEGGNPAIGVSATNNGRGIVHERDEGEDADPRATTIDGAVVEDEATKVDAVEATPKPETTKPDATEATGPTPPTEPPQKGS